MIEEKKVEDQYEIDYDFLLKIKTIDDKYDVYSSLVQAVRAIYYFMKLGKFKLGESLINLIPEDDKKLFKKSNKD
jgi:hypothetical protein